VVVMHIFYPSKTSPHLLGNKKIGTNSSKKKEPGSLLTSEQRFFHLHYLSTKPNLIYLHLTVRMKLSIAVKQSFSCFSSMASKKQKRNVSVCTI